MRRPSFLLAAIVVCVASCAPQTRRAPSPAMSLNPAIDAVEEARRSKGTLIAAGTLREWTGEPDAKVTVSELHRRVLKEMETKSPGYDQTTMVRLFDRFRDATSTREDKWQDCDDFLNSTVWLYEWDEPGRLYQGGIVSIEVGRRSAYFLIHDDRVLGAGHVARYVR
jgi:hypothetical protein